MKPKALEIIRCPRCKYEYLPAEIYLPNSFLGKPAGIIRNNNTIESFIGNSMDTSETYICDKCKTTFRVYATVAFSTEEKPKLNFDEEYTTPLTKTALFLEED